MTLAEFINNLEMGVHAETEDNGSTTIYFDNVEQDYQLEVDNVEDIYNAWQNFDIEEEVAMWLEAKRNGDKAVPYVTDLVKEEETIDKTLEDLFVKTRDFKEV